MPRVKTFITRKTIEAMKQSAQFLSDNSAMYGHAILVLIQEYERLLEIADLSADVLKAKNAPLNEVELKLKTRLEEIPKV